MAASDATVATATSAMNPAAVVAVIQSQPQQSTTSTVVDEGMKLSLSRVLTIKKLILASPIHVPGTEEFLVRAHDMLHSFRSVY